MAGVEFGRGVANYSAEQARRLIGLQRRMLTRPSGAGVPLLEPIPVAAAGSPLRAARFPPWPAAGDPGCSPSRPFRSR